MNILYIHGLNSELNPQKREMLEKYGKIYAPSINYHNDPNAIENIKNQYADINIDVVIGSSMGGFAGYYISDAIDCPALLFNPALKKRAVEQNIPAFKNPARNFKQLVIGQRDETVNPSDTLNFIANRISGVTDLHISLRHEMEHRVTPECFEEELERFFSRLG